MDLQELYQDLILDHNKRPRNRRPLTDADRHADGYNPLCGDKVRINIKLNGDVIEEATFEGSGCAISTASASLMTEALTGKSIDEARAVFKKFHEMLTAEARHGATAGQDLGKLAVFSGVSRYPARVKCATLAWHTLTAALDDCADPVTTE
jgi:nitrogen fixation NifU-like protein